MKRKSVWIITFIIIIFSFLTYFYLNNSYEKIDIFTAKGFHKETSAPIISITDKSILAETSTIFKASLEMGGILNVAEPNYVLELHSFGKPKTTIYLWISQDSINGMFIYKNRTETGYLISDKNTEKLKDIVIPTQK